MPNIYQDYLKENILKQPGLIAWWPLDDLSGASYARVLHPPLVVGRNIVLNPTPTSATSWTLGANWTYASSLFTHTTGSTATVTQAIGTSVVSGRVYSITYTVSGMTVGTITVALGASGTARSANGTYTESIVSSATTLTYTPSSTFDGSISGFSVTELGIPANGCYYNNPTIIADGDMEAVGTASWTAGNSATLSKQSGTPHSGTQCLRIARNAVSSPYASQTVLTVGTAYRVFGYCRSDGTALPIVYQGSTVLFTGTASTSWQSFDVVFVCASTDVRFGTSTNTGTQYVEFDDCTVVTDTSLRLGEIIQDGDMEASGVGIWVASESTLSKQTSTPHGGSQVLRITANAAAGAHNPQAFQRILALGKRYRITGYCRSDGTQVPKVIQNATTLFTGTTSTSWQLFDAIVVASTTPIVFFFAITGPVGTEYVEFDDISVTEISPMVGLPVNGVAQQSPAFGHLLNAYNFDASNDLVNIYSAQLNSVFNPDEGTLVIWAKVSTASVWTDGAGRFICTIFADANNRLIIQKSVSNNISTVFYIAGSTSKSVNITSRQLGWYSIALTYSKTNDQLKAYMNSIQVGAVVTGLGTWVGNLSSVTTVVGSSSTTPGSLWSGWINDVRLYNRALTSLEIRLLYYKYLPQFQTRYT